jgi:hypothetical protein
VNCKVETKETDGVSEMGKECDGGGIRYLSFIEDKFGVRDGWVGELELQM